MPFGEARGKKQGPPWQHPYVAAAGMVACVVASSWALEAWRERMPVAGRLAFGLLPMASAAYLIWTMARWIRDLDELQRKIQAEALSLAYTLAILLAVAFNYLHKAGFRLPLGWEDGMGMLVVLYASCSAIVNPIPSIFDPLKTLSLLAASARGAPAAEPAGVKRGVMPGTTSPSRIVSPSQSPRRAQTHAISRLASPGHL